MTRKLHLSHVHLTSTITRDGKLRALTLPLKIVKAERRRKLWRSTYSIRTMAIVCIVATTLIAYGHAVLAATGMMATGLWIVTGQARRAARLDGSIPGWWVEEAIATDLSDEGRSALTDLLLQPSLSSEQALRWAHAELRRPLPRSGDRHGIAEAVRF